MSDRSARVRKALRLLLVGSITATAVILAWAVLTPPVGALRGQIVLTSLGVVTGAIVADIAIASLGEARRRAVVCLAALLVSEIFYDLLIWTRWKAAGPLGWRLWWGSFVLCATSAHLLALRRAAPLRNDWVERLTTYASALSGALLVTLAFRPESPPVLHPVYVATLAVTALLSIGGSWILWRRTARGAGEPRPMGRLAKLSWILATQAAVFMAGYYVGGGGRTEDFDPFPSALVGLNEEQVEAQTRADFDRLKTTVAGLEELERKAAAFQAELKAKRRAELRDYYRPEEEHQVRWIYATYLSHRAALLRMVATYRGFKCVPEGPARARRMTVGYAAALTAYEYSLKFVRTYLDEPAARQKLNEREDAWGIPEGMFDRIHRSVTRPEHLQAVYEMAAYYRERGPSWREAAVWPPAEFGWLDDRISRSRDYVEANSLSPAKRWLEDLVTYVKSDVYDPVYRAQSMLSEWIGDTKMAQYPPLIRVEQVKELEKRLNPGDIFLERRNWYLSNAFLPGFWPHSAIYIGRLDDLKRLGIADHPAVRERLQAYLRKAPDGEVLTVLESVSEGVIFNSVTESMHADFVAVLRPRIPERQIGEAIARAFSHHGKPYDFEFDFFTSDKLVCTELVYRAYEGFLHFDLVKVMGRDTLPAVEIFQKFARERATPKQELDFVAYLEGDRRARCARPADEQAFLKSVERNAVFAE